MSPSSWLIAVIAFTAALLLTLYGEGVPLTFPQEFIPTQAPADVSPDIKKEIAPATTTEASAPKVATLTPKKATASAPTAVPTAAKQIPATSIALPQPTQAEFDASAATLRAALVNIFCSVEKSRSFISGSGVVIDARGIILTNAHIAQYFLLMTDKNLGISCTIRAGSPARDAYKAEPIFISPAWINANADALNEYDHLSNGEHDYALLGITKSATSAPLPTSFASVALTNSDLYAKEPATIGSYAAQFLTSEELLFHLTPTMVFGSLKEIYTFKSGTIDIVALGGSAAAQEGSSGGGVVDSSGTLLGIITTSTIEGTTDTRRLYAITARYLRRSYLSETGNMLDTIFEKPLKDLIDDFAPQIPALRSLINY